MHQTDFIEDDEELIQFLGDLQPESESLGRYAATMGRWALTNETVGIIENHQYELISATLSDIEPKGALYQFLVDWNEADLEFVNLRLFNRAMDIRAGLWIDNQNYVESQARTGDVHVGPPPPSPPKMSPRPPKQEIDRPTIGQAIHRELVDLLCPGSKKYLGEKRKSKVALEHAITAISAVIAKDFVVYCYAANFRFRHGSSPSKGGFMELWRPEGRHLRT